MQISEPQHSILCSDSDISLFLAGQGSGKSHIGGLLAYRFISEFPQVRGFIGANTHTQLTQSTLIRIFEVWKSIGILEFNEKTGIGIYVVDKQPPKKWGLDISLRDYYSTIVFKNGAVIFIGSLENAKAHDGKEFGWAILDEVKDTRERDIKEVILGRLRQKGIKLNDRECCPLYFLTSPAKVKWLNEMFELDEHIEEITNKCISEVDYFIKEIEKEVKKTVVISSTYHNLHNLSANYIENIKANNTAEVAKSLIYGYPFTSSGSEYYSSFSNIKHIKNVSYNPEMPLHISFDQNTKPYSSATIWQIRLQKEDNVLVCIDEVTLKHPQNTTEHVAREILKRYRAHKGGMYVYGDASGMNKNSLSPSIRNHYQIIETILAPFLSNLSIRVLKRNEPHLKRRPFINAIFESKFNFSIEINKNCVNLIEDLMFVKEDENGAKSKKEKHQDGGEKYGHTSDTLDYFIISLLKNIYDNYAKFN
jgi:hypothetical protein